LHNVVRLQQKELAMAYGKKSGMKKKGGKKK